MNHNIIYNFFVNTNIMLSIGCYFIFDTSMFFFFSNKNPHVSEDNALVSINYTMVGEIMNAN